MIRAWYSTWSAPYQFIPKGIRFASFFIRDEALLKYQAHSATVSVRWDFTPQKLFSPPPFWVKVELCEKVDTKNVLIG